MKLAHFTKQNGHEKSSVTANSKIQNCWLFSRCCWHCWKRIFSDEYREEERTTHAMTKMNHYYCLYSLKFGTSDLNCKRKIHNFFYFYFDSKIHNLKIVNLRNNILPRHFLCFKCVYVYLGCNKRNIRSFFCHLGTA